MIHLTWQTGAVTFWVVLGAVAAILVAYAINQIPPIKKGPKWLQISIVIGALVLGLVLGVASAKKLQSSDPSQPPSASHIASPTPADPTETQSTPQLTSSPQASPSQNGSERIVQIVPLRLRDPGVVLMAHNDDDMLVQFSSRVIKPAPRGMSRFLVAKLSDVGADRHTDFYVWKEITKNATYVRDFSDSDLNSKRIVRVYLVDATCASTLREVDEDTPQSISLCIHGAWRPDSNGFEATIKKKK